jgi:hypothetical protein
MPDAHVEERRRRTRTLTDGDLEALVEALQCTKCSFNHDEAETLRSIARNTNTASKLATRTIITGIVLGFLGLVWFALTHLANEIIKTGTIPK